MTWRELSEALETESLRLGIPLDHLEVYTPSGRPVQSIHTDLARDDLHRARLVVL